MDLSWYESGLLFFFNPSLNSHFPLWEICTNFCELQSVNFVSKKIITNLLRFIACALTLSMQTSYFQVKNLLRIDPEEGLSVKSVTIRRIPRYSLYALQVLRKTHYNYHWNYITYNNRVPETMPLYDILNEFQKGHSHMAVVIRHTDKTGQHSSNNHANGNHMLKLGWTIYLCTMRLQSVII